MIKKRSSLFSTALLALAGFVLSFALASNAVASELRIIFVGNSLTGFNDMPKQFTTLANLHGFHPVVEAYIAYGQKLSDHIKRADLKRALQLKKWDYVVLQEYSNLPLVSPQEFEKSLADFATLVRASGAKPVLFENWPYRDSPIDTIDHLKAAYVKAGATIAADTVPLGHSFDVLARTTSIAMFTDEKHPTPMATYMGASHFLRYFYGVPAQGNVPNGAKSLKDLFSIGASDAELSRVQEAADHFTSF